MVQKYVCMCIYILYIFKLAYAIEIHGRSPPSHVKRKRTSWISLEKRRKIMSKSESSGGGGGNLHTADDIADMSGSGEG